MNEWVTYAGAAAMGEALVSVIEGSGSVTIAAQIDREEEYLSDGDYGDDGFLTNEAGEQA